MLLDTIVSPTITNCNLPSTSFKVNISPVLFDVLTRSLYSDPQMAIVRELLTNAYDSHVMANNTQTPISIHIPSYLDHSFRIRDYGTGLAEEDIMSLYVTLFESTKSNSNDLTGCFGLGSKTPLSYTSSFTVNSYYGLMKKTYLVFKKDGLPEILKIKEEESNEHTGLEIIIPTEGNNQDHDREFHDKLVYYLKFVPEVLVAFEGNIKIDREYPAYSNNFVKLYNKDSYHKGKVFIKQGQNVFKVDYGRYQVNDVITNLFNHNYDIITEVPIGTLGITPSRETLSDDLTNNTKITLMLQQLETRLNNILYDKEFHKEIEESGNSSTRNLLRVATNFKYFNDTSTAYYFRGILVPTHRNENMVYEANYLNFNDVSDDSYTCYGIEENEEVVVIYGYDNNKFYTYNQFKGVIENYPELQNKTILTVKVAKEYQNKPVSLSVYTKDMAIPKFLNTIWVLNELEEYNFNITPININKFKLFYTNTRRTNKIYAEEKEVIPAYIGRNIRVRRLTASNFWTSGGSYGSIESIGYIKKFYEPENTVIVLDERNDPCLLLPSMNNKVSDILHTKVNTLKTLSKFTDRKGDNILYSYLKHHYLNIDFTDSVKFMTIGKSVVDEFKEYTKFSFSEIFKLFQDADWCLDLNNIGGDYGYFFKNYPVLFKNSFKPKAYKYIKKTSTYKKLGLLRNLFDFDVVTNRVEYPSELFNIRLFIDTTDKEKRFRFNPRFFNDKVKELYYLTRNCDTQRIGYNKYLDNTPENRRINHRSRLEILKLLKGDI